MSDFNKYPAYTGPDCSLRACPYAPSSAFVADVVDQAKLVVFSEYNARVNSEYPTPPIRALHVYLSPALMLHETTVIINVKIAMFSSGSQSGYFTWKYETDRAYSGLIPFATRVAGAFPSDLTDPMLLDPPQAVGTYPSNGQTETGIRVWFDPTTVAGDVYTVTIERPPGGYHWIPSNDNTLHYPVECSNHGKCDRETGLCECFAGFSGEACQRTKCPSDCSGHGICQSGYMFREEAMEMGYTTGSYGSQYNYFTDPYDAHTVLGCMCDDGYRGTDCSQKECPSLRDPLLNEETNWPSQDCSGRGLCDYTTGLCECFRGYFGDACEEQESTNNFV